MSFFEFVIGATLVVPYVLLVVLLFFFVDNLVRGRSD
jgi:hypothetical protein